ncbi:MAG: hypothetical protein KAT14_04930, partial [Candidatus Marinimicrobia bacterium]|nr:hypothetical protein [Candidatus Neomarinimicrobiota bacterium]
MFNDNMSHGEAFQYAMTDYFFSSFGRNANFIDYVNGQLIYKYFRKSMFYQFCILGDPSARFPKKHITDSFNLSPKSVTSGETVILQVEEPNITKGVMDIVGTRQQERKFPIQQKIKIDFNQNEASFIMPSHDNSISDGMIQLTYWDANGNVYVGAEHISLNAPYIESIDYYPFQPAVSDSGVVIRMNIASNRDIDGAYLRIYNDQSTEENYQKLALTAVNNTRYETSDNIYYTGKSTFYTAENDTSEAITCYSGNYFMPVFFIDGDSLTGDFYRLSPQISPSKDIAILEYAIENGKSKLVLYNQADTSAHVVLTMTVLDSGFTRSYYDTLLTINDVEGQYESGTDKINTYYFDFLPTYGTSTFEIKIDPI